MSKKSIIEKIFLICFIVISIPLDHVKTSANMVEVEKDVYVRNGTEEPISSDIQIPRNNIASSVRFRFAK